MSDKGHIWAFDLGKGSIGEAVRDTSTNEFVHAASLLIPPELARRGPADQSGTPANRYRAWKTRLAHRERERWLETVWRQAGLTPLQPREVCKNPDTGRWELKHKGDYRLEREFAPELGEKTKDGAPSDDAGVNICYTSCLLRIKLLRWKPGDPPLEEWQVYKALRAAMQKRGYGRVPWTTKEARAKGKTPEELEQEEEAKLAKADPHYREAAGKWAEFKRAVPAEYHFPCYYDAYQMGLWDPAKPNELRTRPDHTARSTRNVRFDRADVRRELVMLGNNAAAMIPELQQAFERWQRDGWEFKHPVTGKVLTYPVKARTFGEFLCDGPAGQPDETSFEAFLNQRRDAKIRLGTFEEWMAALGQKTPKFDNRIVGYCALIPRLHVCKMAPRRKKKPDGCLELEPRSLLAAETTFLLQLKNLQVDDPNLNAVRYLKPEELNEWLERARRKALSVPFSDTWQKGVLNCFKITKAEWREWCESKNLLPVSAGDRDAEVQKRAATEGGTFAVATETDADTESVQGKSEDVVKAPKLAGRSRFCRPALAILRYLILHKEPPTEFTRRLRAGDEQLLAELELELVNGPPERLRLKERPQGEKGRTWLLYEDLDFLEHIWKPTDRDGKPRTYEPHQLRIPDMNLRYLRAKYGLSEKPYSELLKENSKELARRDKAIWEIIGRQANPVVRDRLIRFWQRLKHFQNPVVSPDPVKQKPGLGLPDPECIVLEFVRDDSDSSLEGRQRVEAIKQAIKQNEARREQARKALAACGLPITDEMIVRWLLLDAQGPACIYTNKPISCKDLPNLQIEHIVPKSRGGPDAFWNWVLCDEDANAEKGERTPYEWFKDEKTEEEWAEYKRRVLSRQTKLGMRKVDLLLRPDAAELAGEKYTALAETSWIARVAQSIARLHFGWPLEDEPGKERVITISGPLTARIRRKYLLDSLLGADEEAEKLRENITNTLAELEALPADAALNEDARKYKRAELRQKLRDLANDSEKNRADERHHALDAMVLTFLPNWIRDRNKEDFFRFPTEIGDNALYSNEDRPKVEALKSELARLYEQHKGVFRQIKQARLAGEFGKLQELKALIFPVRKRMAELYRALDRFKQPRNVGAVRAWFMAQLNGALGTRRLPVLPLTAARCKSRVEARLYRRVYVVYRDRSERALVKLTELALAPDPRDPSKKTFDLKWLRARIHAIAEHHGYDSKALKNALQLNLDAALDTCVSAGRSFTRTDWEHICWKPAVLMCFNPSVSSRFQSTVGPPDCLVKVHKVEILPAARYPLAELPYTRAITYVWNPEHFAQLVTRILRKDDSQPKRRRRVLHQSLHEQALPHVNAEPSPWPGFVWDRELQTKMQSPAFKQQLESELVPYLLPPKPPRMTQAEQAEWKKQEDDWQRRFEDFRVRHRLPKSLFIFTAGADLPPKRPNMSLMRVLFERKEKAFSTHVLLKQTESVVDPQLRNCLKCFAASLGALHDPRLQEKLWKQFCACFCVVTKDSLEKFLQSHPSVTPEQWIAFFESQAGPRVTFVTQLVGTSLEEYFDLSKDACGAFARGENKGYWVCKKGDRIEARPIRYFETPDQVKQRLLKHGWELLDPKPWRTGDLLRLPVAAGTGTRYLPAGYYLLGSFSNDTGINLKPCFGGEVPQNISFKALWYQGLRRCLGVL